MSSQTDQTPEFEVGSGEGDNQTDRHPASLAFDGMPPAGGSNKSGRAFVWLCLCLTFIVAVAALALAIFLWQQAAARQPAVASETSKADIAALTARQDQFATSLSGFQSQMDAALAQMQSSRQAVASLMAKKTQDDTIWQLSEAQHLLQMANYSLYFSHDIKTTIGLLEAADMRLQPMTDAQIYTVRKLIADDITQLQSVRVVDVPGTYMRLDALSQATLKLPLLQTEFKERPDNYLAAKDPTEKGSFLHGFWRALSRVVVIRRHDQPMAPLLSGQDSRMVLETMSLLFSEAQWGLLQQNQTVYQASIQKIIDLLNTYFQHNDTQTLAIIKQLQSLAALTVKPVVPQVGQALTALNVYVKQQKETLLTAPPPTATTKESDEGAAQP